MELMIICVLVFCIKSVKALVVTNTTVQIVLAICGSLVGIVLIAVLLCCCCIYWYSKKQDLDGISDSIQPRRLRPLRPVRTVTPNFMSSGISMEDFEYLHQQSREEFAGLPTSSRHYYRDAPCQFYRSRQENSNPLSNQPNDSLNIVSPPSYNQSELIHQSQNETRANNLLGGRREPSALENHNESKRNVEQPSEYAQSGMNTDREDQTSHVETMATDEIVADSEQEAPEVRKTTSSRELPPLPDIPRQKVDINETKTSVDLLPEESPKITKGKGVRVINVEDSDQTKKIKRISLAKRLKTEVISPKLTSMEPRNETSYFSGESGI